MVKKFIIFISLGLSILMVWMLWNMSSFYSKQINTSNLNTSNNIDFLYHILMKIDNSLLPDYINENLDKYNNWLD